LKFESFGYQNFEVRISKVFQELHFSVDFDETEMWIEMICLL